MKRITFSEGLVVAVIMAVAAGVIFFPFAMLTGTGIALRVAITTLSAAYGVYLMTRSQERSGFIALCAAWLLISLICWLIAPGLVLFSAIHLGLMWLTRALYHCSSPLTAGLDLMLHAFALLTAIWGAVQTNNIMVSVWCLFLMLALFVWLPNGTKDSVASSPNTRHTKRDFNEAYATARNAAEKLAKA